MTNSTDPNNNGLSAIDTGLSTFKKVIKAIEQMFPLSQAAMAIFMSQLVENILEDSLTSKLTISSNNFKNQLFEGYGPLSTFTAKIDMVRALEIVDEETYNTLRIIKSIRNEVAHPDTSSFPNFDDEAIVKECRKLPGYIDDENCFKLFLSVTASIIVSIDDSEEVSAFSELIMDSFSEQKSSAQKSP